MADKIEYNSILTEREFTASDEFKRAHKSSVICDASGRKMGSISKKALFNLFGEPIAEFVKEETCERNGKNVRVAEYASDTARYTLVGDDLYAADNGETFLGRVAKTQRNVAHIVILSVLAAMLIAAIVIIALIGMPQTTDGGNGGGGGGNTDIVTPPPDDGDDDDFSIAPVIDVTDTLGAWAEQGEIAVFGNGLYPGTSGNYKFILNNPEDVEVKYSFYITAQYNGTVVAEFPLRFRIKMNNLYVTEWCTADELRLEDMQLLAKSSHAFVLEWEWPFESDNDENDTIIGSDGGTLSMVLHLTAEQAR